MKRQVLGLMFVAVIAVLAGCAGLKPIGSQRVVETIPNGEPSWKGKSMWEEKGSIFYVGSVSNRSDMALAQREARANGEKKLAEQIKVKIRTEFGSAIEGQNQDNQTGAYVKDLIVKASENIEVSGVKESENFVQKVEETTASGVRYVYNTYALLALDRADYLEARKRALDGAMAEAKKAQNARAEESLKRAFEKLDGTASVSTAKQ